MRHQSASAEGAAPARPLPEPLSYTLIGAATATGLSRATLYRLQQAGKLRFFKVGKRTLVCARSLHALLTSEAA